MDVDLFVYFIFTFRVCEIRVTGARARLSVAFLTAAKRKAILEKLKKFPAGIRKKLGYRNRWVLK